MLSVLQLRTELGAFGDDKQPIAHNDNAWILDEAQDVE